MSLTEYQCKRHFKRTPEPAGKRAAKPGHLFVVQKHQARQLHYDFRLELDGVLKSWAVPKGPSLDPSVKRLAVQVEDHPVEYGSFEGIIPPGEYGGGTVMLWDQGEWEPVGDPEDGYRAGRLKFKLHGAKLRGGWMLVHTGGGASGRDKRQWLLIKERDEEATPSKDGDILEHMPLSVATGRSLEEIAADRHRVWTSKAKSPMQSARQTPRKKSATERSQRTSVAAAIPGRKTRSLPSRVAVQLATLAAEAPEGDEWLHEIKLDGYRMICRIANGRVAFMSRNHQDWTARFPALVAAAQRLPIRQAIFDGEVVAVRPDGSTNFQDLQNAFRDVRTDQLYYFVFDILHLDGHDLAGLPLAERKRLLAKLLGETGVPPTIRLSEHIEGNGPAFFKKVCAMGLEGIISKRRDQPYRPGRGYDWLKVKCMQTGEFVIGGFTEPTGGRAKFGALLLGYYNAKGELVYAGKVGTGFDNRTLHSLFARLKPLEQDESPFSNLPRGGPKTHWVEPRLVAQVTFGGWTRDGLLRHPSFQGLREDKPAAEVTRDLAIPVSSAMRRQRSSKSPPQGVNGRNGRDRRMKKSGPNGAANGETGYDANEQRLAGVRLTSPDKILYPEQRITKLELAQYYQAIAEWMLPHIADRPLVLVRCPEGRGKACFYQKHPSPGTPDTLRRIPVREKAKTEDYVIVDDVAGLISLAQIGALEIHAWGARADNLEQPDRLIFDLDPDPSVSWSRVVDSAGAVRDFLQELGLTSFVKTTGGKGLHLVVPILRRQDWEEVKAFCKRVADAIVAADAARYTANMSKAARPGKIFIDYLRNARGATAVVPYSPRARPGAPVSVPLTWKELSPRIGPAQFTIRNIMDRLRSLKRDPWEEIASVRQGLAGPIKKLQTVFTS
ncbi:hypothetical protein AYO44_10160 [Planctomycetaceae bacterium SCGC AG-212-F19]|nr:hypothetical protein AYO44_10160 [Planctomycetaceae bacterium SCGC AG-212-F19]